MAADDSAMPLSLSLSHDHERTSSEWKGREATADSRVRLEEERKRIDVVGGG
jgi:hypothetical protein